MAQAAALGVLLGPMDGGAKIAVWSVVSSGDITLTVGGQSVTQTPTQFEGTFWYTEFEADWLNAVGGFARYPYTLTQAGNPGSVSAHVWSMPTDADDFILSFCSCDKNFPSGLQSARDVGYWEYIYARAQTSEVPVVGVIFPDDHGYVDALNPDDTAGSGLACTGICQETALAADYGIAHMACLGVLTMQDPDTDVGNYRQIDWGRMAERLWCRQNLWILPQWGDHEFTNDIGWDLPTTDVSTSPTMAAIYAAGKAAWDVTYGLVQPPKLNADHGNAWGIRVGPLYICAPDYITNATGTYAADGTVSQLLGTDQISDIRTAMDNDAPVKILALGFGIRYLYDPASAAEFTSGTQHPLFNHVLSEYQALFTSEGLTPPSLMDNPRDNGLRGVLFTAHGDYHRAKWEYHHKPAYTGNAAENFHSITVGTTNGSTNFGIQSGVGDTSIVAGAELPAGGADPGLTRLDYLGKPWASGNGGADYWGLWFDVYGSRYPKEVHVSLRGPATQEDSSDGNYDEDLRTRKFIHRYGGNDAHLADVEVASMASISSGFDI